MRAMPLKALLLCAATAAGAQSPAQTLVSHSEPEAPRIVFVCEHGSVKSLIAASYFNRRAQSRGLTARAIARGVAPEPAVPPIVRDGLHAAGFDVSGFVPQALKASDLNGAILAVSFDEEISDSVAGRVRYLKWDNLPGVLSDYVRGRDAILKQVDSLLDELGAEPRRER